MKAAKIWILASQAEADRDVALARGASLLGVEYARLAHRVRTLQACAEEAQAREIREEVGLLDGPGQNKPAPG